jgi:hypothetical protein
MDEDIQEPQPAHEKLTFPDVIKAVFTDYVGFAERHLKEPNPPAMLVAVWLIGMDAVAGGIELENVLGQQSAVQDWFHTWIRIMVGGAAAGALRYWLVGSLFHVMVLGAGGKGPARTSRYIFLYAALPVSVVDLSIKVLQMLVYGNGYFIGSTNAALEGVFAALMLAAFGYTLILCYRGMRTLMEADRRRSIAILAAVTAGMVAFVIIATR